MELSPADVIENQPGDVESNTSEGSRISTRQIFVYSIANFGISMAWSVSFALTTPFFAQVLRAGPVISHFIWALGPISGLVVAPIIGALSDRSTSRYGRRRPFVAAGAIVVAISMMVFSNAPTVARLLLPRNVTEGTFHAVSIAVATVAFAFSDFALNASMWPLRALQGDLVPSAQQHAMQGASVAVGSFGDFTGQLLLAIYPQSVSHAPAVYAVCVMVLVTTILLLLYTADEVPWRPKLQKAGAEGKSLRDTMLGGLRIVPNWMKRLACCHALCFFAFFCVVPNFSSWFATAVTQGSPGSREGSREALRFERGVSLYGRAGILRSLTQILLAAVYPYVVKREHAGRALGVAHAFFGVVALALASTHNEKLGSLVVIASALPLSATMTLVIAEVSARADSTQRGRLLGLLNVSACIPQLIDTMYTGPLSHRFGEQWVVRVGALWALAAAFAGFMVWPLKQSKY
jgi:solute carrier family 45, member 1/2/4